MRVAETCITCTMYLYSPVLWLAWCTWTAQMTHHSDVTVPKWTSVSHVHVNRTIKASHTKTTSVHHHMKFTLAQHSSRHNAQQHTAVHSLDMQLPRTSLSTGLVLCAASFVGTLPMRQVHLVHSCGRTDNIQLWTHLLHRGSESLTIVHQASHAFTTHWLVLSEWMSEWVSEWLSRV